MQPHELQYAKVPCPSLCAWFCSNSCPLSQWCIQPSHPLSSSSSPAFDLSQHQGLFQWIGNEHQVAKVLEYYHQSFQWIFRFDVFRIYWFDLLAFTGIVKSILQYHSSKASILWHSAFFMVQQSHLYMTTWKTIALAMQTFVSKVMLLHFNTVWVCHNFSSKEQMSFNFVG